MLKKKGDLPSFTTFVLLAIVGLAIILIIFGPKLGIAKDTLFDLLGIGEETCIETGTKYSEQMQDLRKAIEQGKYTETKLAFETLQACYPQKQNEVKKEMISSYNSYIEKVKTFDAQEFIDLYKFVETKLGSDSKEIETEQLRIKLKNAYFELITKSLDKIKDYLEKEKSIPAYLTLASLEFMQLTEELKTLKELCNENIGYEHVANDVKTKCDNEVAADLKKVYLEFIQEYWLVVETNNKIPINQFQWGQVAGGLANLKELCNINIGFEKIVQEIKEKCNIQKIIDAENNFIITDCSNWKTLAETESTNANSLCNEQNFRYGRTSIDRCAQAQANAYTIYGFIIGKFQLPKCESIIENAKTKQKEIEQFIADLNRKYPHRDPQTLKLLPEEDYKLTTLMCELVGKVPSRYRTDQVTISEVSLFNCNYLKENKEICDACTPILATAES